MDDKKEEKLLRLGRKAKLTNYYFLPDCDEFEICYKGHYFGEPFPSKIFVVSSNFPRYR